MAGYIGSKASVVSSGAERKKTYAITASTTSLTGLVYTPNMVHVFHNGIRLVDGTDYTATNGTTITLTNAAANGDEVVVVNQATFQTSDTVSASAGGTFSNAVTVTGNLNTTNVLPSTDNASDLGSTAKRFQDLHLSGGVSFDEDPSLVTGSVIAKTLDDYEEGNFTPALGGITLSVANGFYRKIGRVVHCWIQINSSSITDGTSASLSGFPFTAAGNTEAGRAAGVTVYTSGATNYGLLFNSGTTVASFRTIPNGATATRTQVSGTLFWLQVTYTSTS